MTWSPGGGPLVGSPSPSNSLVGETADAVVGNAGTHLLPNGNYVVLSPYWEDGAISNIGAITWADGATGAVGPVSGSNSLVGAEDQDQLGGNGITILSTSNYVVSAPWLDADGVVDAGAAVWGNGATGSFGQVTSANALVGTTPSDNVGYSVNALSNGNYVVESLRWDNGSIEDAGAATWGSGLVGVAGAVSGSNSLVGANQYGYVGNVSGLTNGNYVVASPVWDNGMIVDAGAATWRDGSMADPGVVSASNSLVGSTAGDGVSGGGVVALGNGNYVVSSRSWDHGASADVGAVTWGDGTTGVGGLISPINSLVGGSAGDDVGSTVALTNGDYVVASPYWDSTADLDVGALTWGSGASGVVGPVTATNSMTGTAAFDMFADGDAIALPDGFLAVTSSSLVIPASGATTVLAGWGPLSGSVDATNSVFGVGHSIGYQSTLHAVVIGQPTAQRVTWTRAPLPGAPRSATAVQTQTDGTISWLAPLPNGSRPITSYTVTVSPGGMQCTTTSLSCRIAGLTPGTAYTAIIAASNATGAGAQATYNFSTLSPPAPTTTTTTTTVASTEPPPAESTTLAPAVPTSQVLPTVASTIASGEGLLPETGSGSALPLAAIVLVAAGIGLMVISRRRLTVIER